MYYEIERKGFQFPSNGKAYLNMGSGQQLVAVVPKNVSIPFKRESVSEPLAIAIALVGCGGFNSLQTGKRIWTLKDEKFKEADSSRFQFPSNGKAYLNYI